MQIFVVLVLECHRLVVWARRMRRPQFRAQKTSHHCCAVSLRSLHTRFTYFLASSSLVITKSCMLSWRAFSGQPRSLLLSQIATTSLPRIFATSNMSSYSVGSLKYISREQLADHIRSKKPGISVIDVRDSDYIGGHIMGCQNVPVHTHDFKMPELARTLADQEAVIFHCSLSQQRGPKSALNYLRERERMGMTKDGGDEKQKVYVLEGGFSKWQEAFVTPNYPFCRQIADLAGLTGMARTKN